MNKFLAGRKRLCDIGNTMSSRIGTINQNINNKYDCHHCNFSSNNKDAMVRHMACHSVHTAVDVTEQALNTERRNSAVNTERQARRNLSNTFDQAISPLSLHNLENTPRQASDSPRTSNLHTPRSHSNYSGIRYSRTVQTPLTGRTRRSRSRTRGPRLSNEGNVYRNYYLIIVIGDGLIKFVMFKKFIFLSQFTVLKKTTVIITEINS